jgi:thymidylate synthase
MSAGFPLLLSKKVSFKAAKFELLWILQGRTDIQYLRDNGLTIGTTIINALDVQTER